MVKRFNINEDFITENGSILLYIGDVPKVRHAGIIAQLNRAYQSGYDDGQENATEEYNNGHLDGYSEGYDEGNSIGYDEGYNAGKAFEDD